MKKEFRQRPGQRPRRRRPRKRQPVYERPRIEPGLHHVFKQIGVPEKAPFQPDPFQKEALELVKDYDVLVSAPTGAGKTWIASQAILDCLKNHKKVWYASPLKALSNSIYNEFCRTFGSDSCGIVTGDRKENSDAPVIVGTTEILRNQLYDVMHEGAVLQVDLVIIDEAHYLSDPDRGVVWEEVLIYLPARVRLLLLSATISNADEICGWLRTIRGTKIEVVRSDERPVPLEFLFLFPDGLLSPLAGRKGLVPKIRKFMGGPRHKRQNRSTKLQYGKIIEELRQFDLLPAIFFLKSRADCDNALLSCPAVKSSASERKRIRQVVTSFLEKYPHLEGHRQLHRLMDCRVASHHGGQLPYWKVLVEKVMGTGLLEAIFSTSTVAAGVNFPARTVVLVQSDRYNGREFSDLTSTELHQMTGRAGRRGKDHIGFVLIIPGRHQDPQLIHELRDSSPEPIESQIHINFSMTLNLLLSHRPQEIKELLARSFAAYQRRGQGRNIFAGPDKKGDELWQSFERHLRFLQKTGFVEKDGALTPDGYWASKLRLDQPLLIAEAIRKGGLSGTDPSLLAGGLAPFVWDRSQEVLLRADEKYDWEEMEAFFDRVLASIDTLRKRKSRAGFDDPVIFFWPAIALYMWTKGISWDELLFIVPIDEGDMASLIMRTADHLRQVAGLADTHPDLAKCAREAVERVLREPVYLL
ncbi:MAG: ATP-dependent DNA helicase [Deltaproteobacteria bacterium]|nr:MAG: ATP-dependent DNA helicase [Deltaproteobacteria bacterium]